VKGQHLRIHNTFIRVGEAVTIRLVVYWPLVGLEGSLSLLMGLTILGLAWGGFQFLLENQNRSEAFIP
jgi:hypothetical protein